MKAQFILVLIYLSAHFFSNANSVQEKLERDLISGEIQSLKFSESCKGVWELSSFGVDVTAIVNTSTMEYKLASWRGESGKIRFAVGINACSSLSLEISTTDKIGPVGSYLLKKITENLDNHWHAERNLMLGLDLHYRHYLKEFDRRDEAVVLMQKALDYWLQQNDPREISRVSYELAALHRGMGNLLEAYEKYALAKDSYFAIDDLNGAAAAANVMGLIDRKQGRYEQAIERFKTARSWRNSIGLTKQAAISSNNIALIDLDRGNLINAIDAFRQAISGYGWGDELDLHIASIGKEHFVNAVAEKGDVRRAALMFSNLALAHDDFGDHQEAIDFWQKSLSLSEYISDQAGIGLIKNNLGRAFFDRGILDKSQLFLFDAEQTLAAVNNLEYMSLVKYNLGELYFVMGKHNNALDHYQEAARLRTEHENQSGYFDSILAIGKVHKSLGQPKMAADSYYQAEKGFNELELKGKQGITLFELADLYFSNGDFKQAAKLAKSALALLESNGSMRDQAKINLLLGDIYFSLNELQTARQYSDVARQITLNANDKLLEPGVLLLQSKISNQQGDKKTALKAAKDSVTRFKMLANQLKLPGDLASFTSSYYSSVTHLANLLIKGGHDLDALKVFDQVKGRTFGYWAYSTDDRAELNRVLERINSKETLKASLLGVEAKQTVVDNLERDIRVLYRNLEVMTAEPQPDKDVAFSMPQVTSDTVILQYMLSENRSQGFLIKDGLVKSFVMPDQMHLENMVKNLHVAVKTHNRGLWLNISSALEKAIFPPELENEEVVKLVIIADGALQTVPFAALKVNGQLIIDRFEISYAPSLKAFNEINIGGAESTLGVTVFADPVYQIKDDRFKSNNLEGHEKAPASIVGQIRNGKDLQRLNGTKNEAAMIKSFASKNVALKTGFNATRQNVLNDSAASSVLHFAAHSLPNEAMSGLSSIELSRFSDSGVPIDGSLKAIDIAGLKLKAQLVVLSACETSLGQHIRGEGYMGLTRAFLEAGSQNVISTLWKVEDQTTADLMKVFYEGLMHGLTVPNSLRKAQNTIRLTPGKADPYYWAGFVSHGNPNLIFNLGD